MTTTARQPAFGKTFGGNAAENYERYFVPAIGRPLATDLVAAAALQAGERVLDVACGTGVVTRLAAEQVGPGGSVAGADLTANMLEVARSAAPPKSGIQWYETSAEAMPLPDHAFDVVFCQLGLQFVADKAAAAREMHRVLVPGGRRAGDRADAEPVFRRVRTGACAPRSRSCAVRRAGVFAERSCGARALVPRRRLQGRHDSIDAQEAASAAGAGVFLAVRSVHSHLRPGGGSRSSGPGGARTRGRRRMAGVGN